MITTKILPESSPYHFVVEPIIRNTAKVGGVLLHTINKADSKANRATEGIVKVVPDKVWIDSLTALRMDLISSHDQYVKPILIKGEDLGIREGDIIGYHADEVDTLELDEDDYLLVKGDRILYARNEDGVKGAMGWVILEKLKKPDMTPGGIYYPTERFYDDRFTIHSVPPEYNYAGVGDEVLVEINQGTKKPLVIHTYIDGKEYVRAASNRIFARYEQVLQ